MDTSITLDEPHYRTLADNARAAGQTPQQYLHALIDAAAQTFDEILTPARNGFASMTDTDLESLLERARKAARQPD